jgi:hypothetical protein
MPAGGMSKTCVQGGVFFSSWHSMPIAVLGQLGDQREKLQSFGWLGRVSAAVMERYISSFGRCWDRPASSLVYPQTTISLGISPIYNQYISNLPIT